MTVTMMDNAAHITAHHTEQSLSHKIFHDGSNNNDDSGNQLNHVIKTLSPD